MNVKPLLAPVLALVVGLLAGAALDTWWERPRLPRARAEHERADRLEGVITGLHK
jgi:hypothetical protein